MGGGTRFLLIGITERCAARPEMRAAAAEWCGLQPLRNGRRVPAVSFCPGLLYVDTEAVNAIGPFDAAVGPSTLEEIGRRASR